MPEPPETYDITRPLGAGTPVWPGDAPCRLQWTARLEHGAPANVSELALTAHAGTHVDAPLHGLPDGEDVGTMRLAAFAGPALLVEAGGGEWIGEELVEAVVGPGDSPPRVLFRTGCWTDPARFPRRFPALTPGAAGRLRAGGVLLVGTDAPSVDPFGSEDLPAHRVLCGAGIAIVENLLLDGVPPGRYELLALPLRLTGADASPVRAVLRRG